ncbi:MAG: cytochrome b/b6 domain-containing protein [Pseudomonadota bacterium]
MSATHTAATNTPTTYGWVERAFHWAIALLIPTAIVLGVVAYDAPFGTDEELAWKATLFSAHKTVGITIFFVALARIAWALSQPRPRTLHPDRTLETFAASTVHWLLYGSLILVPALGWAHHATAEGFAPIWWPFGQSLPFLPKDPDLSATLATLHMTFERVLVAALILHIVGTLKHVVIDKDSTFGRMWRGTDPGPLPEGGRHLLAPLSAVVVWAGALGAGLFLASDGATATTTATVTAQTEAASNWTVEEGTLSITVTQLGQPVTGSFADWQAAIDFDETPRDDGSFGQVEVVIATGSLGLGSVTQQATEAAFLDSAGFPTATFTATIVPDGEDYLADGTLDLRGVSVPVQMPFRLQIDGDIATMEGQVELDRRDYNMGEAYPDETSVGFGVTVDVTLTAQRGA